MVDLGLVISTIGCAAAILGARYAFLSYKKNCHMADVSERDRIIAANPRFNLSGEVLGFENGKLKYQVDILNVSKQVANILEIQFDCFLEDTNNSLLYYTMPVKERVFDALLRYEDDPLKMVATVNLDGAISQKKLTVSLFITYKNRYDDEVLIKQEVGVVDIEPYVRQNNAVMDEYVNE